LRVPIALTDPSAAQALEIVLRYDPARLRFTRLRALGAAAGVLVRATAADPGVLRIAAASPTSFAGVRLVALFAPRTAGASMADLRGGAATVDEQPARVAVARGAGRR
jgi:hypothetical protein